MIPVKQKLKIINNKAIGDVLYDALKDWYPSMSDEMKMVMVERTIPILKERYKSQMPKKEKVKQISITDNV